KRRGEPSLELGGSTDAGGGGIDVGDIRGISTWIEVDSSTAPGVSTTARSITFLSSRTFPDQRWRRSTVFAFSESVGGTTPIISAQRSMKNSASGTISSVRSLSGGTIKETPFNRK